VAESGISNRHLLFYLVSVLTLIGVRLARAEEAAASDAGRSTQASASPPSQLQPPPGPWCAAEFEALPGEVCVYTPPATATPPENLVIFLHGVVKEGTDWQYNQQRAAARVARQNGFVVLMPRGRMGGAGSQKFSDHWNWPTSVEGQKLYEKAVLDEWRSARAIVEQRRGIAFDRVYVLGFSAGAYYAVSLAIGNRFAADGFAAFAGGGAARNTARHLRRVRPRIPIYVGWGLKDKARDDPAKLAKVLKAAGWPHKASARRGVGHAMTDSQVREAIAFFEKKLAARARTGKQQRN
jgi:poly(3-hydroxybutyrate) depolymerase